MSLLICTDDPNVVFHVRAPSSKDVISALTSLNNEDRTGLILTLPVGMLFVYGGNQNRVWVRFRGQTSSNELRAGTLLDKTYSREDGEVDISVEGEVNPVPLYATVSKETAAMVAAYFLEHGDFPDDLVWRGQIKE